MSRYYCPFCTSSYQLYETRHDGVLICAKCGDPLMKKPVINSRKFFALFLSSAFLAPLVIMIVFVIKDITNKQTFKNMENVVLMTFN